jgi:hypothetical protein
MALLAPPALVLGRRLLFAGLTVLLLSAAPAQTASREYQIKAVFLFNFTQFVEWPAATFSDPQAPLVIGVLGDDPFGSLLETATRNEKAGEHPLEIRRFQSAAQADCHILFISRSESGKLETILESLAGKPILTVSDADQAARRGVMIRFISENNRIRLRINLESAKLAGLTISSKLLRSAEIVRTTQ